QRTQEIGVRLALRATPRRVLQMVMTQGMRLVALGAVVGVIAALAAGTLLRSLLFRVSGHDPVALAGSVALLLVVAALASYLPARRATRVDPLVALRYE